MCLPLYCLHLGLKLSPSPTFLLILIWCWRGTRAGCERAALPDSAGVSCLTAVPEPSPLSETELGGYYYLSFIHNLTRRFLFMVCQSQAVPYSLGSYSFSSIPRLAVNNCTVSRTVPDCTFFFSSFIKHIFRGGYLEGIQRTNVVICNYNVQNE